MPRVEIGRGRTIPIPDLNRDLVMRETSGSSSLRKRVEQLQQQLNQAQSAAQQAEQARQQAQARAERAEQQASQLQQQVQQLQQSMYTEAQAKQIAQISFQRGVQAVIDYLKQRGII